MSVSCSNVCVITIATPSTQARLIATYGVFHFGWTRAIGSNSSLSSAIAKKMRGEASMLPISDPNVEIITITETNDTPICPNSAPIVSAEISRDFAMTPIGLM